MKNFLSSLKQYPPDATENQAYPEDTVQNQPSIHHQNFGKLDDIHYKLHLIEEELRQGRYPEDLNILPVQTNANGQALTQPWHVDYRNRKHLFAYISGKTSVDFISDDGFTLTLTNTWTNVGFSEGTILMPVTASVNVLLRARATDEVIP